MHFHPKIQTLPDFDSIATLCPLPDPVGSCACREVSDCSNGRRVVPSPAYSDERVVVCGRGKGAYNRPANKAFRSLIRSHLPSYLKAPNKYQKGVVIERITHDVEARGLVFVRKSEDTRDEWCELDTKERRDKIGHAIREAVAEQNKKAASNKHSIMGHSSSYQDADADHHLMASDSTISSTHSLDGSEGFEDQDLEDRRLRFDRMLESFRMGQTKSTVMPSEDDGLLLTNLAYFQV